jgi:hypothetical protein
MKSARLSQCCTLAACGCLFSVLIGCGGASGTSVKAGPIVINNQGGGAGIQVSSLSISSSLNLSMTPVNDSANAGVDWTVTCGGNPVTGSTTGGACGTLAPTHTAGGVSTVYTAPGQIPLNTTVTVIASVTSNPSQNSTVTFTVLQQPIAIMFSTAPASSVIVGGTVSVVAIVSNDRTNAGVSWTVTCASSNCGSFSPPIIPSGSGTIYTAPLAVPAGDGTVTITASSIADPTKSVSTTIEVQSTAPPGAEISVSVLPASFYTQTVGSTRSTKLTATVLNDPSNKGVDWKLSCSLSNCGTITAHTASGIVNTYSAPTAAVAPSGGTVTIAATSTTDPTKSFIVTANVVTSAPIVVTMSTPPPATLMAGSQVTLGASVSSGTLGVDWTATCGGVACGSFNLTPAHTASSGTITYTAPAAVPVGSVVDITASSPATTPANSDTRATTILSRVSFTQPPPPTILVNSSATLAATVANDTGNVGLNWTATCGGAACGSFSPSHTLSGVSTIYTAPSSVPAGSAVTITASSPVTTPPNTASSITTILVQPPTVAFAQQPPATLSGGTTAPIVATVSNDVPPGGVTWTVQCGSTVAGACGAITPYQTASGTTATYTAPPVTSTGTTVTIKATSIADPSVSINSMPVAIVPNTNLSINFIPAPPAQLQTDGTASLNAAVENDSTLAGIDWNVCSSGCGFFTMKPATPEIKPTATTPDVPAEPAVTATAVSAWPNGLTIPYTTPHQVPSSGAVTITASAHADSTKVITASIAISTAATGAAINGTVLAGSQPVMGASVALYAAGTSGYASASTQISSTVTSDNNGNFALPAGYTCLSSAQVYLVATGGSVGTNDINPNLALMTVLGNCDSIGSGSLVVNEATTIASAWPLAPFAADDPFTGNTSYLYIGTSSSNAIGLANAFAAVNNLVDITTGKARFTVPAGNAIVPYIEINTLADTLNVCTDTSGGALGDASPCGALFAATATLGSPSSTYQSVVPTDTLQAAFNIAQHPTTSNGYSLGDLFSLVGPGAPFQPVLTSAPNDWSISLSYTAGGGLSPASAVGSFAIDATGNLWITDTKAGSVVEWNTVGAALSPSAGFSVGGGPIVIDAAGNPWISGDSRLTKLTNLGTPYPGSPFPGVAGGGNDMAIDEQSNVWITTSNSISEFSSLGMELSPSGGFVNSGVTNIGPLTIDSSNKLWAENLLSGHALTNIANLTNPGSQLIVNPATSASPDISQIAADSSGNVWYPDMGAGGICEMAAYAGTGIIEQENCHIGGGVSVASNGIETFNAQGIAVDGAGLIWAASMGGGSSPVIPPNVLGLNPSGGIPGWFVSPTLAADPLRVAIDGSGNVWVLLANNTVTEYVGLATPAVTPIALGLQKQKLGSKP